MDLTDVLGTKGVADLTGATLVGADLTGADLGIANLTGATLARADLIGGGEGGRRCVRSPVPRQGSAFRASHAIEQVRVGADRPARPGRPGARRGAVGGVLPPRRAAFFHPTDIDVAANTPHDPAPID